MLPNLLYDGENSAKIMHPCTVFDLKIDALLGKTSSEILLFEPTKKNILFRQQMFKLLLLNPEKSKKIEALLTKLTDCQRLYEAYKATEYSKSKHYIFVFLASSLCDFYCLSRENMGLGERFDSFSATFDEICENEKFSIIKKSLSALLDDVNSFQNVVFIVNGENMIVERKTVTSYSDILLSCANELGINLSTGRKKNIVLQDAIVDAIAKLHPLQFQKISEFYNEYNSFFDFDVFKYITQFEFILSVFSLTENAIRHNIPYCFPCISAEKTVDLKNVYDISLLEKTQKIVPNNVYFDKNEPFFYLTGANGGGKTTFLRSVGIALMLFLGGCPVFCDTGSAPVIDFVFTHFPKDERFEGTGRFIDEENRVNAILNDATENSIILLNETYSSTNEDKSIDCTIALANTIASRGIFGLYITHQHRIESENSYTGPENETKIPFLSAVIDENDNNKRTFKIERRRVSEKSFASDILKKYNLSKEQLHQRFSRYKTKK